MANNRIVWEGLAELKAALRALPLELAYEGSSIVTSSAVAARDEIFAAYPERTGNLRQHLQLGDGTTIGRFGASTILKNNAPHAWIFENGTQARHTNLGAFRGSAPPGHVFIPRVMKHRRLMYLRLKAMLERHGLLVSGDEAA